MDEQKLVKAGTRAGDLLCHTRYSNFGSKNRYTTYLHTIATLRIVTHGFHASAITLEPTAGHIKISATYLHTYSVSTI